MGTKYLECVVTFGKVKNEYRLNILDKVFSFYNIYIFKVKRSCRIHKNI